MRRVSALLTAALAVVATLVGVAPPASAAAITGAYVPLTQARIYSGQATPLAHRQAVSIPVAGKDGIPTSGVAAVALTLTVVKATGSGGITAYPSGTALPGTTNLQYASGIESSNLVVTRLGGGRVSFFNTAGTGSAVLYVDAVGYYRSGTSSGAGNLQTVTPARAADVTIGQHANSAPKLAGVAGLPSSGVGLVAVTITIYGAAASGGLVAYDNGPNTPTQSTVHFRAGQRVAQFAIVPLSSTGKLGLFNNAGGSTRVLVDVSGWFAAGVATTAGALQPLSPATVSTATYSARQAKTVTVGGHGGVPRTKAGAALVMVTAASPSSTGSAAAFMSGTAPAIRTVTYNAGRYTSGLALVRLTSTGTFQLYNNSSASVQLSVDVYGFVPAADLAIPATTSSRYLDDLTEDLDADVSVMQDDGCSDATQSPELVILDVGAQSYHDPLSTDSPGVAVALAHTTGGGQLRLTYGQLRTVLDAYLASFSSCLPASAGPVRIAIGTNNSGNFTDDSDPTNPGYRATARGVDWAADVIEPLRADAPSGLTVLAADDIEDGGDFDADPANAQAWETAYLGATTANLVYNGSANGCPTTFGTGGPTTACDPANHWTLATYYGLAHNGSRISVVPQIYYPQLAVQWANIDRAGGGAINLDGSLTEYSIDPSTSPPAQAYAALYWAAATIVSSPGLPDATDIQHGSAATAARTRYVGTAG